MNRVQEHLAQANGHLAQLTVQIVRQRIIVKYAVDTDQPSEMAESLLHALEQSLAHSRSIANWFSISWKAPTEAPRPVAKFRRAGTWPPRLRRLAGVVTQLIQRRRLTLGSVEGDGCPKNDTHCRC